MKKMITLLCLIFCVGFAQVALAAPSKNPNGKVYIKKEGVGFGDFKMYPNPAENWINIDFEDIYPSLEVQIMDTEGKRVMKKKIKTGERIEVDKLSRGIYWLVLMNKENNQLVGARKLIKE